MFIIEDSIANSFNLKSQNVDIYRVNLGLAHGVIGVLKMCIQCTQAGICEEDSKLVAKKIIDFILKNTHQKGAVSIFPSFCSNDSKIEDSRLGWCYGDLIIGYILYQAAEIFDDYILLQHANNVLIETTYRRLPKETYVRDASICHGSIGIAHIYNKIWRLTNNLIYRNAAEFWIDYSLEKENYLQGENCFMKFNAYSNRYEKNLSLLEGSAGIGLALISFITEDYSWDHCLMLN
ncbi:Lanthionine synthetase C-like protein [Mucilaginibacter gotjawali]|nr:lanthionine synthetase LanC family protein [Mucilaginibacter gotjawali]BAU55615.1 Lanthionine synthetase C-like protein [Mucilaginibacter gotjawali]